MPQIQNAAEPSMDSERVIVELVKRLYRADVTTCTKLNGYDDLNFHIAIQRSPNSGLQEAAYVMKIMQSGSKLSSVRAQTKLLLHVTHLGIIAPVPVQNVNGEYWSQESVDPEGDGRDMRIVRLLSFIPGRILCSLPITEQLLYEAGSYLARFHVAVKGISDEGFNRDDFIWTLVNVPKLTSYLTAVPDSSRRDLAQEIIASWSYVEQQYPHFTKGILHGDPNEMNILVSEEPPEHVYGLIDFGDSQSGYLMFDVAMLIAYMLMYSTVDPLDIGMHVLAGYTKVAPLNANELDALFFAVAGRLAQSVVLGLHTYALTKNRYVLNTQVPGWRALGHLSSTGKDVVLRRWLTGVKDSRVLEQVSNSAVASAVQ